MPLTNAAGHWLAETLSQNYGAKYKPEQSRAIFDALAPDISDDQLQEAIDRHIHNKLDDGGGIDGTPVGSWPPTVAHIEQQLTRMYADRRREKQAEEKKKRAQESDRTYARAMKSDLWRTEIRKGAAIKAAVIKKFNLQTRRPEDMKIIMDTLKSMQGDAGLIDDIPRARETAARLIIARDKTLQKEAA